MKVESLQSTLDTEEEREHYPWGASTVVLGSALPAAMVFGVPTRPTAFVPMAATVTIAGTVFVYTEPSPQWLTIYPTIKPETSLDVLEDLDIPFKPKKKRRVKGIVIKRSKAEFKTAFTDDLVGDTNIS